MTVKVRGRVPRWSKDTAAEQSAQHIQERLHALEVALAGGAPQFMSPSTPTFGSGSPPLGGGGGGVIIPPGGGGGVTDHGALTGLGDDDHPQYLKHYESVQGLPHGHGVDDIAGVEQRFVHRLERVVPAPHQHSMKDVADLRPDDVQFVLASRIFGG